VKIERRRRIDRWIKGNQKLPIKIRVWGKGERENAEEEEK